MTGINALATANTTTLLFTTEANQGRFIVESIKSVCTSVTGTIATSAVSIGVTGVVSPGSGFTDIVVTFAQIATVINQTANAVVVTTHLTVAPSTPMYLKIITAGIIASVYTFEIFVRGYYELGDL